MLATLSTTKMVTIFNHHESHPLIAPLKWMTQMKHLLASKRISEESKNG
jgi:hypothetical protein